MPTVPSDEALDSFYNPAGYISSAVIKQNSVTPLVGTPVTMSTLTPNADTQITWMYFEIRPTSQPVLTAPIINSFSASPASIVLNDSSILAWSVSGNPIPTLTIDHQVGDVSGQTSVSVSPTQTTIYTLTAQNGLGSATAQVTVTVFPQDNQPPSVPTGLSASATSYFQIDLSWIASTDNVGVTGYKIYRDGVQIGTSSVNSYSDTGLAPSTTYTYKVSAYDSSGNDSGQSDPAQATTQSAPTSNLTINAAVTYQTMNGVGSNINSWSWKNGELTPALDDLINTLGHNIFRVVHDRMEWAGSGNTRPAAVLTGLQNLDSATLQSVYEVSDMQDLWNTIAYLNSKGVSGDQIIVNFMGWTAPWMGGSGEYGVPSYITNNAQTNQDIATMIASLVYYGHHRRDVSGANQNLSFSYIAPFNEPNLNGLEGPLVSASQMNAIYKNIVTTLNTMGDTSTMILSPDTIGDPDGYTSEFSAAVIARMAHFSWHDYGGNPVNPATSRNGVNADWMTETSKWCDGCDNNQPPSESEWSFGSGTADIILGDIKNGFSAVLTWEGFDTFYYHHDSYSAWGHVGCTQNGSGCTTSDTYPRVYTIRGRAWPEATIARAISPGMVRRGVTTTNISHLTVLSFYDSVTGRFSIVGHNTGSSPITINGQLQNLPSINSLSLYETNVSLHLQHMNDVPVNNTLFTATIPPDTFFYLATTTGP